MDNAICHPTRVRLGGLLLTFLIVATNSACGQRPAPAAASTVPASAPVSGATQRPPDTTLVVTRDGLEFSLTLAPVPRKIGEEFEVGLLVRNIGVGPLKVRIPRCYPRTRGPKVIVGASCQVAASELTLKPGGTWPEIPHSVLIAGPAGRQRLEVMASFEPEVWIGIDLDLAP